MASTLSKASFVALRARPGRRCLHQTKVRLAVTNFQMPAMSPTMTEGGIASWKKKEGERFTAGDVLLEIETDKATIDVEAQEDGIVGKILVQDGAKNVPIGKVIALLAEEDDDTSNLEAPKDEPATSKEGVPSSSTVPTPVSEPARSTPELHAASSHTATLPPHSKPLFPSVHRLILENGIKDPNEIRGTGVRGMLTKGDVLAYLGKASSPNGTFKSSLSPVQEAITQGKRSVEPQTLDGFALRRLIVSSMLRSSSKARNPQPDFTGADFESIIGDYLPVAWNQHPPVAPSRPAPKGVADYLHGLY